MGDISPDSSKLLGAILALSNEERSTNQIVSDDFFDDANVLQYWQATQKKLQIEDDSDNAIALYAIQSLYGHRGTIDPVDSEPRFISGFPLPRNWSVLIPPTLNLSKTQLTFAAKGGEQQYCVWVPDDSANDHASGYLKDEFIDNAGISRTTVVLDNVIDVDPININVKSSLNKTEHRFNQHTMLTQDMIINQLHLKNQTSRKSHKFKGPSTIHGPSRGATSDRILTVSQGDVSHSIHLGDEWTMASFLTFTEEYSQITGTANKPKELKTRHVLRITTYKFIPSGSLVPDIDASYIDTDIDNSILITPYMFSCADTVDQEIPLLILTDADTQASYINKKLIFPPPDNIMDMMARTAIMKMVTGTLVDVVDKEIEHLENETQHVLNGVINAHSQTLYQLLSTTPRMVPSSVAGSLTDVKIYYDDNCLLSVGESGNTSINDWDKINQRISQNESFQKSYDVSVMEKFDMEFNTASYTIDGNQVTLRFTHKTESEVKIPIIVRIVDAPPFGYGFIATIDMFEGFTLENRDTDQFNIDMTVIRLEWPGTSAETASVSVTAEITTLTIDEDGAIKAKSEEKTYQLELEPEVDSNGVITFTGSSLSIPISKYRVRGDIERYVSSTYSTIYRPDPIGIFNSDVNSFVVDHIIKGHVPENTRVVDYGTKKLNAPYNPNYTVISYVSNVSVLGSVRALRNPSTFSPPFINTNDEYLLGIILNMSYDLNKLHDELDDLDDRLNALEKSLQGSTLQMVGEIFLGFGSLLPFGAPMGILILAGAGILFVDAARSGDVFTAVNQLVNIFIGAITIHHTTSKQRMAVFDSLSRAYDSIMNSARSMKNDFKRSCLNSLVNRNAGVRNKSKTFNAYYSGLLVNEHSHIAVLQSGLTMLPDAIGPHLSSKPGPVGALSRYLDKKNLALSHSELLLQQSKNVEGDILGVMGTMGVGSNVGVNNVNPKRGSNPQMGGLGSTMFFYKIDDYDSVTGVAKRSLYKLSYNASPDDLRYEASYHYKMVYPDATKEDIANWMKSTDYSDDNGIIWKRSQEIHESKLRSLKGYTLNNYSADRELSPEVMLELFNMYNENQSSENFRYNLTRNNCHMMAKVPASIIMGYEPEKLPRSAYALPYAESLSRVLTRELSSLDNALDPFRVHSYQSWDRMVAGFYRTNSAYHSGEWGVKLYTSSSIDNVQLHNKLIFGTYLQL